MIPFTITDAQFKLNEICDNEIRLNIKLFFKFNSTMIVLLLNNSAVNNAS